MSVRWHQKEALLELLGSTGGKKKKKNESDWPALNVIDKVYRVTFQVLPPRYQTF